jgi:hypothetical protein
MKMRRFLLTTTTAALLCWGFAPSVSAQVTPQAERGAPPTDPRNPSMTSQRFDQEKEILYAIFSENKSGASVEQQNRAYGAAKTYLQRYEGDNDVYVKEAKKFVADFDQRVNEYEILTTYNSRNYAKVFELGRPVLKKDPANFFVLSVLAEAGYDNALAGKADLNDETLGYVRKAIELLEAGNVSKPDPFKNVAAGAGFLNNALGTFVKDKSPVEAAAAFLKAVQPRSPYENDPLTYYRLGLAILKGPYAQLSSEYNEKYGAKESSAEQRAMLEKIIHQASRAIDAYARAVALSDPARTAAAAPVSQFTPEFRSKVLAQLTALYKNFHNDSDAGLNELISGVLAKPLP